MKTTIINHKKYAVEHVFRMVGNWYFTDKNGIAHLVDGEDVSAFGGSGDCYFEEDGEVGGKMQYLCTTHNYTVADTNTKPCERFVKNPHITDDTAIAYAKELAANNEDGIFWWTTKESEQAI